MKDLRIASFLVLALAALALPAGCKKQKPELDPGTANSIFKKPSSDDATLGPRVVMPGISLQPPKGDFARSELPASVVLQSIKEPRWNVSITPHPDTDVNLAELKDMVTSLHSAGSPVTSPAETVDLGGYQSAKLVSNVRIKDDDLFTVTYAIPVKRDAGPGVVYQIVYMARIRDQATMAPVFEASAKGIVLTDI